MIPVSRETRVDEANEHTPEAAIAALKIPPADRTPQHLDAILAIVGTWIDFNMFVRSDQVRREVCRQMRFDSHEANTILFKEGDEPDGWYFIFSGQCSIYIRVPDESFHSQIPAQVVTVLRDSFGPEACFMCCAVKGPTKHFEMRQSSLMSFLKSSESITNITARQLLGLLAFNLRKRSHFFRTFPNFSFFMIRGIYFRDWLTT
jgi:hypothetical protein